MSQPGEITSLLRRLRSGDRAALDLLVEKAYPELHRIAEAHFRHERAGHLLQPTALVNEAWQKFVALDAVELSDRVHFLSLCSRLMRQILVDHARRRAIHERAVSSMRADDRGEENTLDLDLALRKLEEAQPRAARVVELRYFGGLSTDEIAQCLDVSLATVKRDWLAARAWLYGQLHGEPV
jgi:RNA polymerase sigma factor (TIGR02999 family)